jgi:AmmeMemoRadiSam system protein A
MMKLDRTLTSDPCSTGLLMVVARPVQPMLPISTQEKLFALHLARRALYEYLGRGVLPEYRTELPGLLQLRGTFVTLLRRDDGRLRGCRGEPQARRPLIESALRQAIAAATDDPRFPAVTEEEVPGLSIHISALTPPRPIRPEEVVLGRHGLIILKGRRSGLLLPEVRDLFGLRDRWEFLEALCRKARLAEGAWSESDAQLYAFETERWSDEDDPRETPPVMSTAST